MPSATDFTKLVPGFDFLQGLMKGAGQALPSMNQWIAPTLDPVELEKRIEQLRTVQFWLEQNAKLLAASIQALEVQRMTLATLKTMNVPLDRMRDAFMLAPQAPAAAAAPAPSPAPEAAPAPAPAPAPAVDPMQWWGALTQQFTELASNAMKDSRSEAAKARKPDAPPDAAPAAKPAAKKRKR